MFQLYLVVLLTGGITILSLCFLTRGSDVLPETRIFGIILIGSIVGFLSGCFYLFASIL